MIIRFIIFLLVIAFFVVILYNFLKDITGNARKIHTKLKKSSLNNSKAKARTPRKRSC